MKTVSSGICDKRDSKGTVTVPIQRYLLSFTRQYKTMYSYFFVPLNYFRKYNAPYMHFSNRFLSEVRTLYVSQWLNI